MLGRKRQNSGHNTTNAILRVDAEDEDFLFIIDMKPFYFHLWSLLQTIASHEDDFVSFKCYTKRPCIEIPQTSTSASMKSSLFKWGFIKLTEELRFMKS